MSFSIYFGFSHISFFMGLKPPLITFPLVISQLKLTAIDFPFQILQLKLTVINLLLQIIYCSWLQPTVEMNFSIYFGFSHTILKVLFFH
jgi:hypothetical protein